MIKAADVETSAQMISIQKAAEFKDCMNNIAKKKNKNPLYLFSRIKKTKNIKTKNEKSSSQMRSAAIINNYRKLAKSSTVCNYLVVVHHEIYIS